MEYAGIFYAVLGMVTVTVAYIVGYVIPKLNWEQEKPMRKIRENEMWYDRKRTLFGLPLSFTKYTLTNDRLFIETGLLKSREQEVPNFYKQWDELQ